jgi:uncharacterized protein
VHFTPVDAAEEVSAWLGAGVTYLPQCGENLGERMENAFAEAFAAGFDRVVIVGSDLPGLSADLLREALRMLEQGPVIGPARDGGYWLLGLREPTPSLFRDVAWSTPGVLAATLERFARLGGRPAFLPELVDVDEAADLPEL